MTSFSFPNMVDGSQSIMNDGNKADLMNLHLLIGSSKLRLLGDPYFGTNLKSLLYDKDNPTLADMVIDDIYAAIRIFMPQLILTRDDISIQIDHETMYINVSCKNNVDFTTNLYKLNLMDV